MSELIAETEPTKALEGSGTVGDLITLGQDAYQDAISWNTAFDAAMVGVDYLTWAENPLGGLISAGVGWLLEHLPFISDVWDKLTGDAAKIEQTAATWDNISHALEAAMQSYENASGEIEQWTGPAATSYRACADAFTAALGGVAGQCGAYGLVTTGIGALVATVKDLIYTIISEFIEFTVLPAILGAIATSWCTFGGSIGVAITYIEIQADIAGIQITAKIATGTEEVVVISERTAKSVDKVLDMRDALKKLGDEVEENKNWAKEALKSASHGGFEKGKGVVTPPAEEPGGEEPGGGEPGGEAPGGGEPGGEEPTGAQNGGGVPVGASRGGGE